MSSVPPYLQQAGLSHKLQKARQNAASNERMDLRMMPDISEWGQKFFYLYDTADLIVLYDAQIQGLRRALTLNDDGTFKFSTVLWSWPKKSAKSTIIAMVVDWMATHRARSAIRLAANDRNQADSRVGHYLRESIKLGAKLGYPADSTGQMQMFRQQTKISYSNYTIEYPNGTIIEMVPADPRGEAGGNDDLLVFSELWGWNTKAHRQLWSELTIAPTRYGYAQRWVDTYAGFTDNSPVLYQLYNTVVKPENRVDREYEFYESASIFATWITRPHFPWQTKEYYTQEQESLEVSEFERLHRNKWASSSSAFAPEVWWTRCERSQAPPQHYKLLPAEEKFKYIPPHFEDEEIVLAIDAATDSDCFALVGGAKFFEEDAVTGEKVPKIVTRYVKAWYPEQYEGHFDFSEPFEEVIRLCNKYNVIQLAYDRYQMKHFIDLLDKENLTWLDPFEQQSERSIADKLLYDMIRRRHFVHWGDPEHSEHFKNAAKKVDGKVLRIVKKEETKKIDLLVATSMMVKRTMELVPDI